MKIKFTKYQEVQESGKKNYNFSAPSRNVVDGHHDNHYSTRTHRLDRAAPLAETLKE